MIGVFTIPIGDIMHAKQKERDDDLAMLDYVIEQVMLIHRNEAPPTYSSQAPAPIQATIQTDESAAPKQASRKGSLSKKSSSR